MTTREEIARIICCAEHGGCILRDCEPSGDDVTACIALKGYHDKTIDAMMAALTPPEPTDTNRAENILREFEELHGQITIDERKWLRDRIATEITPPEPTNKMIEDGASAIVDQIITRDIAPENIGAAKLAISGAVLAAALRAMPLQEGSKS